MPKMDFGAAGNRFERNLYRTPDGGTRANENLDLFCPRQIRAASSLCESARGETLCQAKNLYCKTCLP